MYAKGCAVSEIHKATKIYLPILGVRVKTGVDECFRASSKLAELETSHQQIM